MYLIGLHSGSYEAGTWTELESIIIKIIAIQEGVKEEGNGWSRWGIGRVRKYLFLFDDKVKPSNNEDLAAEKKKKKKKSDKVADAPKVEKKEAEVQKEEVEVEDESVDI